MLKEADLKEALLVEEDHPLKKICNPNYQTFWGQNKALTINLLQKKDRESKNSVEKFQMKFWIKFQFMGNHSN